MPVVGHSYAWDLTILGGEHTMYGMVDISSRMAYIYPCQCEWGALCPQLDAAMPSDRGNLTYVGIETRSPGGLSYAYCKAYTCRKPHTSSGDHTMHVVRSMCTMYGVEEVGCT